MSTHSRPDLFPAALASLRAQTYDPLEIVVLVNGAAGDSVALLERCDDSRLRWFTTQPALVMPAAWNRVCQEAHGKYFLFCSDDDILIPDAVSKQVDLMEAHPNIGFCHADWIKVDDDNNVIGSWASHKRYFIEKGAAAWRKYLVRTGCCMSTVVVRRELWSKVGGWDECAGHPADNSLYLKLLHYSDEGHVPFTTCRYRVRTRPPDSWEQRFHALRDYYALGTRSISDPPIGVRDLARVRRRLMNRLGRDGILLLSAASTEDQIRDLTSWLEEEVFPGMRLYWLISAGTHLHLLTMAAGVISACNAMLGVAKSIVVGLQRTIEPAPSPI